MVVPQVEKLDDEVVNEPQTEGHQQHLAGRSLRLLAGRQHVGDGRAFREWELAVEVFDKVPPQRDQQNHTQVSADQAGEEDLQKRRFEIEDVERRNREDRTCNHHPRGLADGLDDDVLEQRVTAREKGPEKDREDRDRDRCFDDVAGLEPDVGGGEGEDHHHDHADDQGPCRNLRARVVGRDHRGVGLTRLQLSECVLRQDLGGLGRFHQYPPRVSNSNARSLSGREIELGIRN
jgi:hypothetical protein